MNKDEKRAKQAEALHQELEKSRTVILSGFEGITVAQDFDLRRKIAQIGAKYKVVKNSLIERASQGTPLEPAAKELSGTTSLAYTQEDPVALAKVLTAYAKENPLLKFKSGVVEGRVVSMADLSIRRQLAREGGAVLKGALPDQFAGAERGGCPRRRGPQVGGGHSTGRQRKEVYGGSEQLAKAFSLQGLPARG